MGKSPIVGVDTNQRRAQRVERHVPPMTNYARAWLIPIVATPPRKIIPMEWLSAELPHWPFWHFPQGI